MSNTQFLLSPDQRVIYDADNCPYNVLDIGGDIFPVVTTRQNIESVRGFPVRPDDIWLCNYPKSGTHWLYQVVSMLLNGSADYNYDSKQNTMIDFLTDKDSVGALPTPRFFNSHLTPARLPEHLFSSGTRVIFTYRDPKDVAVSMYHHFRQMKCYQYTGNFHGFFPRWLEGAVDYGSWFRHMKEWLPVLEKKQDNVLILKFANLKKDLKSNVAAIAKFLRIEANDDLVSSIAAKCQFSSMQKALSCTETDKFTEGTGNSVYRKGIVGDWRTVLTSEESSMVDAALCQLIGKGKLPEHRRTEEARSCRTDAEPRF